MLLESVYVVAVVLILGGIVLVFIDKWYNKVSDDQEITYPIALKSVCFR